MSNCIELYYSDRHNIASEQLRYEIPAMNQSKDKECLIKLGANLKKVRKSAGITQGEMAEKTKFHRTYISQIERGITNPTLLSMQTLAEGLDTSIEVLIEDVFSDSSDLSKDDKELHADKAKEGYDYK